MPHPIRSILLPACLLAFAHAQTFEVASVKENKSGELSLGVRYLPGGKLSGKSVPLFFLIEEAYHLPFQSDWLKGVPDWAMKTRYDIEAAAGAGSQVSNETLRAMLRTLLEDRFKMKVRTETAERAVYEIVVAKGGPKLAKSSKTEKDCDQAEVQLGNSTGCHSLAGGQGRGVHGDAATIADVAFYVSNWADRPVIDKTGLTGLYKFDTEGWQPMRPKAPLPPDHEPTAEERAFSDPTTPTLFVIFDRMGLKLGSSRAPVESFVVEHLERPTEN